MTSFRSAACQYFTSVGSLHTLAETMNRFTTAYMWLVCSFFTWHCSRIFLLKIFLKLFFSYTHQGTIPAVCERTAKVGEKLKV